MWDLEEVDLVLKGKTKPITALLATRKVEEEAPAEAPEEEAPAPAIAPIPAPDNTAITSSDFKKKPAPAPAPETEAVNPADVLDAATWATVKEEILAHANGIAAVAHKQGPTIAITVMALKKSAALMQAVARGDTVDIEAESANWVNLLKHGDEETLVLLNRYRPGWESVLELANKMTATILKAYLVTH